ncbi:MAG TPA: pitrilysin family protein [Patescibacteria group bacterium]|nr:pitrilysin family protein [Patescibacteria group bacterium]
MKYQRKVLKNGLRIITIPMPSFESATAMVMVGAGSRYETKKNNGISHFLEHMAFKGTTKRPTAQDIAGLIDGVGGEFNAFTSEEVTGYFVKAGANHVELCLDVLSDMLQHSKLDQVEIDREKGVILEERNLYEDTPAQNISDVYKQLLYGDTPLGWNIVGTPEVIKSINRQNFVDYMGSLYSPQNITVVIAGGIETKKAEELVEQYFGQMKPFDIVKYKKQQENQIKPALYIKQKNTEQVHIGLGFRTVSTHNEEKHVLSVLAAILGGGMSSRLFSEVREKRGLAYYVRTGAEHYQDVGFLVSTAGLDPKRVDEGIEVIVEQYAKISSSKPGISKQELSKAKEFLKGHFVLGLEDSRSVAGLFAQSEILEKKIETPEQLIAKIDKVTMDQVEAAAKKYFKEAQLNLAIIGNFPDRQRFEKLLKF